MLQEWHSDGLQKAEKGLRTKFGLKTNKVNKKLNKSEKTLKSRKTYKTAGRGALAVGSLGLSEKRARNAYSAAGKATVTQERH